MIKQQDTTIEGIFQKNSDFGSVVQVIVLFFLLVHILIRV